MQTAEREKVVAITIETIVLMRCVVPSLLCWSTVRFRFVSQTNLSVKSKYQCRQVDLKFSKLVGANDLLTLCLIRYSESSQPSTHKGHGR